MGGLFTSLNSSVEALRPRPRCARSFPEQCKQRKHPRLCPASRAGSSRSSFNLSWLSGGVQYGGTLSTQNEYPTKRCERSYRRRGTLRGNRTRWHPFNLCLTFRAKLD